jgi:hypothetical protein
MPLVIAESEKELGLIIAEAASLQEYIKTLKLPDGEYEGK